MKNVRVVRRIIKEVAQYNWQWITFGTENDIVADNLTFKFVQAQYFD